MRIIEYRNRYMERKIQFNDIVCPLNSDYLYLWQISCLECVRCLPWSQSPSLFHPCQVQEIVREQIDQLSLLLYSLFNFQQGGFWVDREREDSACDSTHCPDLKGRIMRIIKGDVSYRLRHYHQLDIKNSKTITVIQLSTSYSRQFIVLTTCWRGDLISVHNRSRNLLFSAVAESSRWMFW